VEQVLIQKKAGKTKWKNRARILLSCPDKPGVVAAVSQFLYEKGANIVQSDQYTTDPEGGQLFMRIEFDLPGLHEQLDKIKLDFADTVEPFEMKWEIRTAEKPKRLAIFVSKEDHCLMELLWQWQADALYADIALVISNHPDSKAAVESHGIPFYHLPVTKETKTNIEKQQLELLAHYDIDVIVLARYMQILSSNFVAAYPNRIINIHHSFLPAFIGSNPYARAYERGVKLIGATAHYVTESLDEGPIIEQDVQRVNHRDNADDLKRIGRHVERIALARAVAWHLEDKILTYNNKTVVFQ
jgi:formyltetrahydrofolate deformylase